MSTLGTFGMVLGVVPAVLATAVLGGISLSNGFEGSSPSNLAPRLIHSAILRQSASDRGSPPLGIRVGPGTTRRAISKLLAASPITSSGPDLPPFSQPANVSSRKPPFPSLP